MTKWHKGVGLTHKDRLNNQCRKQTDRHVLHPFVKPERNLPVGKETHWKVARDKCREGRDHDDDQMIGQIVMTGH